MDYHRVTLKEGADLEGFRRAVRVLIVHAVPPEKVIWGNGEADFFGLSLQEDAPPIDLPRAICTLIESAICHCDLERYALLYRLIWRIRHGEPSLIEVQSDPLVHRLEMMRKSVRRDLHKMHAFLRFRKVETAIDGERYIAWFEPEHDIVEAAAPFFVDRFRTLAWSILTPFASLHWDRTKLIVGPPARREDAPATDAFETAWQAYYESTFNPARVNPTAMRSHMPKKYWRNLPETEAIGSLIREAPQRALAMVAAEAIPPHKRDPAKAVAAMARQEPDSLAALNRLMAASEPLTPGADRAVLGEGPEGAAIAFVGEQPGDQEEQEGRPFVGPAGQLLSEALTASGIERDKAYLTNAVKHFKFELRGKRRLHKSPTAGEVKHYRWWLMKELSFVKPRLVVALGATATLALTGKPVSVTRNRGACRFGDFDGYITVHPSYLLRLPDEAAKREAYAAFRADLDRVRVLVA